MHASLVHTWHMVVGVGTWHMVVGVVGTRHNGLSRVAYAWHLVVIDSLPATYTYIYYYSTTYL